MNIDSREETIKVLFQSCRDGSLATVQQLLTQHSHLRVSLIDDSGNTALIVASENGHTDIVKLLLECGVNVDQKNSNGWTALMKVSENSNLEVVELLLRFGAKVDLRNDGGESALIVAARNCQTELVAKLLRDYGASIEIENNFGWTALMMASLVGCTEVAKLLLDQGAEVDKQDINEWTALIVASLHGHYETVKVLLEFGAKVNIKAIDNYTTALIMASQRKHNKIVELLLKYGAKDDQGTALTHLAASKEVHINTIKLLLEQVAIKVDDHQWLQGAINRASENGRFDIVKLLLECSADDLGWALTLAILNKHSDIVELLLKHGAQVNDENWDYYLDQPPLVEAVEKEDTDMVSLLLKHGAKQGLGWAITEAIFNEHTEIIQMLSEHGAQVDDDNYELNLFSEPTLISACKNGNINVVKLLLEHGAKRYLGWGLVEASENGHLDVVKLLLDKGAQVDHTETDGWTALMIASQGGHLDVVKLLLDKGAQVDITKTDGWTALMIASENGHSDVVKLLLDKGAQVNITETDGTTALMIASENGHSDVVKLLLDKGAQVDITEDDGWTALMIASEDGHLDVVKLLLDKGAQVDLTTTEGWTALMRASQDGHSDVVKLLLDEGAEVDITEDKGRTALMKASQDGHLDVVKLLLDEGAQVDITEDEGWTALMRASQDGYSDVVKLLLDEGAQVDITEDEGWTALMIASQNGHSDVVKLLLDKGAQVDIANDNGWTALMKASQKGHLDVVKLLLDKGAKVDITETDGGTALKKASQNGHLDVVKLLLDKAARVDITETDGTTTLMKASQNGCSDVVKLLLDKGAQVDVTDDKGWTALMIASQGGHSDVVKLLLDKGAQVDITDMNGWTALMKASRNGHSDVVKLLLDKGAKVDIAKDNGLAALMIASRNRHLDVVKLLLDKVHVTETDGWTALMIASQNGHLDVVNLLLDRGAQVDITETDGGTALKIASQNGHSDVVKLLLDKGAQVDITDDKGWTALMIASQDGHLDVVKLLLDKGAQVDLTETDGWTALMIASRNGHSDVVKLLLDKGAQVDIAKDNGLTATSRNRHSDVVKLLLDKGAQIDVTETDGWTALMIASQNRHSDVVKLLLDKGAQVDLTETDGMTALMIASENGHSDVVKLLLDKGAQVDLTETDGTTALVIASENGHSDVIKLLIDKGAEVDIATTNGVTALIIASENGHLDVVKLLLEKGAQVDIEDNFGRSAITVARNTDILLALCAFNTDLPDVGNLDDIPQSDTQYESLDEKEQAQHLIAIENAIRERGQLDHTLVHGVFVGPPRSGKDSLMKRLLGEQITNDSPSTGVAENVVHVKVEKSSTFAATVDQSNWARLTYDEEAVHLMKTASNKISNMTHLPKDSSDEKGITESTDSVMKEIKNTPQQIPEKIATNNTTSGGENLKLQFMSPLEEIFQPPEHPESQPARQHKSPMEIFKEALKSKGLEGLKKQLIKSWSLYLTNTGGQMEFQELLPLLVSGPSIFFITFQLHKDFNQHFSVEYELPSGESSKSYQSSLSILESIFQTLSSISAMGTYVYKGLQRKIVPLRPKVFIIGTHKDLLDQKTAATEIKSIDQHLQDVIKPTSHYREGIIQFASESQMIFAVNNHDPNNSDFQRIRTAVEKVVETGDYRMRSPAHWMIYSLVVRQLQNRIESYDECFAIARECGIKDKSEFTEALHFIHTKMGLVRYFPHEDLKDLVIVDPQILFEKVTELIVETFTFESTCNFSNLEMFKNMGIFSLSDFTRISSRTGQNLTPALFATLLEHLRIAAQFQQNGETKYFLPCVLTHAQAKQSDDTSILPPLIVTFQCGYCPKGLFGTLITYLINNEMESEFEWELDTEKIYRDEVCFQVGPYDTVTIRFLPTHLEVTCVESNPEISRINCTEESVCQEVCQSVEKGIKAVTSTINYINAQHLFTFYCTSESCSYRESHPAKLKKLKGKLCSLRCERLKQCFPLPSGYNKWQLDSPSLISEPAKGTASASHHIESCTRLEKEHHASLFEQLSRYAAKWRTVGTYLGFHGNELDIIEAKPNLHHEGTEGFIREMLSKYLEWSPGDQRGSEQYATLEALRTALSKAGLGATAADFNICVETTDSFTSTDHDISHSATASAIRLGNKRYNESTEELNPKRPRWESS